MLHVVLARCLYTRELGPQHSAVPLTAGGALQIIAQLLNEVAELTAKRNALRFKQKGFIVGSYATSPNLYALEHPPCPYSPDREARFYDGLAAMGPRCGGLEVQLDMQGSMHCFDEEAFLSSFARPRWAAVVTCIGGTMGNVGANAKVGLRASLAGCLPAATLTEREPPP